MTFVKTIPEDQAEGLLADLYKAEIDSKGYVPHYTRRPSVCIPRSTLHGLNLLVQCVARCVYGAMSL